jgi:hypothetical protein
MAGGAVYNGVFRGQVVTPPAGSSGLWVVIPRINGDLPMGPCEAVGGPYAAGTDVIVATIAGIKDDVVVLGERS